MNQSIIFCLCLLLCVSLSAQEKALVDTVLKSKKDLKTVTVTGRKPLVTRKSDRFVINVENSLLANGNTGLEVLQKSPGIWVDRDGTISIKGGQSVTVMINDVVQRMSSEELAEYLKTLRSEDISKIEVISNPPAEYEAAGSGGIVHIILKRSRRDGFNGSLNGQYRQQRNKPYYTMGGSINYKVNRLYLNAGYTFVHDVMPIIDTAYLLFADGGRMYNHTDRINEAMRHQFRVGIGYELSKDQYIEIQNTLPFTRLINTFYTTSDYFRSTETASGATSSDKRRRFTYNGPVLNYLYRIDSLGSKLTIIGEYTINKKTELNNFYETYSGIFNDAVYRSNVPFTTTVYSAQANFTKVLNDKTTITTGAKYVNMKRDNDIVTENYDDSSWKINTGQTNRFIYKERLLMGYASVEQSIKKTMLKAGLRIEHTGSNGNSVTTAEQFRRSYTSLFPSLLVTHTLNSKKENSIYISYTKRIQRPAMNELNPARVLFNNYTALIGNPNLLPEYTHSMEAGFNFLHGYSASVYAWFTSNAINMNVKQGADNAIEYVFKNFGRSRQYGCQFYAPVQLHKWYIVNNSLSLFNLHYNAGQIPDRTTFSARSVHNFTPEKWCDVELVFSYRSPAVYPGWRNPDMFYMDLGLSKKILQKKGVIKLLVTDLFNTIRDLEITDTENSKTVFYRKRVSRMAGVSFTYNFSGGQKFSNRKIESIGNEEKSRVGS